MDGSSGNGASVLPYGQGLGELAEAFLLSKRVSGCTERTLGTYQYWLQRFTLEVQGTTDVVSARRFLPDSRARPVPWQHPSSLPQPQDLLPMGCGNWQPHREPDARLQGPHPEDAPCGAHRDRDPGCLESVWHFSGRQALPCVDPGTDRCRPAGCRGPAATGGGLDPLAARSLRAERQGVEKIGSCSSHRRRLGPFPEYLNTRRVLAREDFLCVSDDGQPVKQRHLVQILHRLSAKADLPLHRRLHQHALRHFAATSWLRNGVGIDEVRRLLGHESLSTTLRYSGLVAGDCSRRARRLQR
jgi:hypothetical protein